MSSSLSLKNYLLSDGNTLMITPPLIKYLLSDGNTLTSSPPLIKKYLLSDGNTLMISRHLIKYLLSDGNTLIYDLTTPQKIRWIVALQSKNLIGESYRGFI